MSVRNRNKEFQGRRVTEFKGDWHKINVHGHTFEWRGHNDVVVQDTTGKLMCEGPGWEVKGVTQMDWERGSHTLHPDDVSRFIQAKIDLSACKG